MRRPSLSLKRDRRGAATILFGASLAATMGASALAVDLGSIYVAKRRLQGMADAAVLSSAETALTGSSRTAAQNMVDRGGAAGARIAALTPGTYVQDKALKPDARFTAGGNTPNAARLTLEQDVPLFFGRLVTGQPTVRISATATAARMDMAAFSLGSRLLALSGGLPNQILSALAGTELSLSVLDGRNLADLDIDILHFTDALGARIGVTGATRAEILGTRVEPRQVLEAMADSAGAATGAAVLRAIAARLPGGGVDMTRLIDLGPLGQGGATSEKQPITIDALSMVRAVLGSNGGKAVLDLGASVPGVTTTRATLLLDGTTERSPWLTVTGSRDVVLRTGRARLYLDAQVGAAISGIASLRLPLYIELATAEARLSDIRCGGNPLTDGVDLAVTPSIGSIAIGEVDPAALDSFGTAAALKPATLANVAGTRITARAQTDLGGTSPQIVHFSRADVDAGITRTVTTPDVVRGIASSLVSKMSVSVTILGITVSLGPVVSAVGSTLALAAPALDTLINQITALLGVQLGSADVRVERMQCGTPVLVG